MARIAEKAYRRAAFRRGNRTPSGWRAAAAKSPRISMRPCTWREKTFAAPLSADGLRPIFSSVGFAEIVFDVRREAALLARRDAAVLAYLRLRDVG